MRKLLFGILFVFSILGCKKSWEVKDSFRNSETADEATNSTVARSQAETDSLVNYFKEVLPTDENFLAISEIDQRIFDIMSLEDTSQTVSMDSSLINELEYVNSNSEYFEDPQNLAIYLNENGHPGDTLVSLFLEKADLVAKLYEERPDLESLHYNDFIDVMNYSYEIVDPQETDVYGRTCAQSYTADIKDCDHNFAVATVFTFFTAAGATIVGTPVAGGAAVLTGIGAAYYQDKICRGTAARHYRECMGYE